LTFKDKLSTLLVQRNMSQTKLAKKSGVAQSGISDFMSGKRVPNGKTMRNLALALEVPVSFLADEDITVNDVKDALETANDVRQTINTAVLNFIKKNNIKLVPVLNKFSDLAEGKKIRSVLTDTTATFAIISNSVKPFEKCLIMINLLETSLENGITYNNLAVEIIEKDVVVIGSITFSGDYVTFTASNGMTATYERKVFFEKATILGKAVQVFVELNDEALETNNLL